MVQKIGMEIYRQATTGVVETHLFNLFDKPNFDYDNNKTEIGKKMCWIYTNFADGIVIMVIGHDDLSPTLVTHASMKRGALL